MESYNYTKAGVNCAQLHKQIVDANLTSATFKGLDLNGDDLNVVFDSALDAGDKTTLDSVVAAHTGAITTSNTQRVSSPDEASTSETTWQQKVAIVAPAMAKGEYLITWYCEIKTDGAGVACQVEYDASERAYTSWNANQYHDFSGSVVVSVNEGDTPNIAIKYKVVGSGPAYIRRGMLSLSLIGQS